MTGVVTLGTVRYTLVKNGGRIQTLIGGGPGVAAGGTIGQVLVKTATPNYATGWTDQSSIAAGTAATLATPRNIDGQAFNGSADITVIAPGTHAAASKATPVDADEMPLADSAAAWGLKKLTWANLKSTLKAYFDTVYQPLAAALTSWAGVTRASGFDTFAATPSSANLRSLLTDETGTGAAVFGTSPTISAPTLTGATDLSGGQIKFPSTQSASSDANTLDDYEEGTFTPGVAFGGATTGIIYSAQVGSYTKVGNRVHFQAYVALSNKGSATGTARLTGLPFTSNATANNFASASAHFSNMTGISGSAQAYIVNGSTLVQLTFLGTGSVGTMADTNFDNATSVIVSGTYFV
jgi:hypothetical protein